MIEIHIASDKMEDKALTSESIALTEKKMDMTLDEIIRLSKKTTKEKRPLRDLNKSRGLLIDRSSQIKSNSKVQSFMESRSSVRQGVLAHRRSSFQGNQFPLTAEVARNVAVMPIRSRVVNQNKPRTTAPVRRNGLEGRFAAPQRNAREGGFTKKVEVLVTTKKKWPQTLDALFANMKEQRMAQQKTRIGFPTANGQQSSGRRQQRRRRRG